MTQTHRFLFGPSRNLTAAAILLFLAPGMRAQSETKEPAAGKPVYGRCEVKAEAARDNFGVCALTGTSDGAVPADRQLAIEHISVSCRGPVAHQIVTLALATGLSQDSGALTQMTIPLTRREVTFNEKESYYEASFAARMYAGPGTKIEPYLIMEFAYTPTPKASCGLMFHGRLTAAQ
jgi:hypothetical protein